MNTLAEGFDLANSLGLNPVVALGDDSHSVPMVRNPIDFSATPPNYHRPPPQLGEHSWEIRRWLEETPEK